MAGHVADGTYAVVMDLKKAALSLQVESTTVGNKADMAVGTTYAIKRIEP